MALDTQTLRLLAQRSYLAQSQSGTAIIANRAVDFEVGCIECGVGIDFDNISSLVLAISASQAATAPLTSVTVASGALDATTITLAQWKAGTAQHATFSFTAGNIATCDLAGEARADFWMALYGVLSGSGRIVPIAMGPLTVISDGSPDVTPDPGVIDTYLTEAQINALIAGVEAGATAWGAITGTLASQTDLQNALDAKAASSHTHTGVYAPALGVDDNYVTDAEKTVIGNTSGTNTGDQDLSGYALTSRKLDDFGTPDDNTDLDATTLKHGLVPKADKVKLDAIEANADVTDTANVTAAGALMDSEVTNLAAVKAFDPAAYAPALGVDDNYVTDAEKIVIGNTSGTNTGDQNLSGYVQTTQIDTLAELNAIVTDATLIDTGDSRLSDSRTPTSHVHGNISNDGKVGATASLPLITGTAGIVQAGAFGTGATDFCVGNDSRLSDARTPAAHASSHVTGGGDAIQLATNAQPGLASAAHISAIEENTAKVTNATHTGDATGATALTLATVNSNVGSFGSATAAPAITVNAKGLVTAASANTITPAVGSITGLGTGVATALAVNVGSAGAPIVLDGALGTPSGGNLSNCTFPTLNQNTTGSAATLTTARTIDGQSFNGSANITVIAPGTNAATSKTTPVDADELPLVDSAASNVLKKLTWANLKATAKTYFDTLYYAAGGALGTPASGTLTSCTVNAPIIAILSGPDVTTDATTGRKAWFRVVKAFTLLSADASFDCTTAPTGSAALLDIEKNGTTIYSTRPQIDASEISSSTGVAGTLSTSPASFAVGDIVGIFLDQIGSTIPGAGYSCTLNVKY